MQTRSSDTRRSAQRLRGAFVVFLAGALTPATALAQVNSGSDGSDGAFNPTSSLVIDMHDHPDGIYQYTSVNIPNGVTVSFIPNDANTPVIWLVQESCVIAGVVLVEGGDQNGAAGALGGPGGYRGGNAPLGGGTVDPGAGLGPGGGKVTPGAAGQVGGNASYGTQGSQTAPFGQHPAGDTYGNDLLLPLFGGSGGSGGKWQDEATGGGGGAGALLIAASNTISISGTINADGGGSSECGAPRGGGGGSGGAVRLVATTLAGAGSISAKGGRAHWSYFYCNDGNSAGNGRIRLEAFQDTFTGPTYGVTTHGLQGVILFPQGQEPKLRLAIIAGLNVPAVPGGSSIPPDVIIPGAQTNPITIVVQCETVPLNSTITVEVKPANGPAIVATGINNTGTVASSTASVSLTMPTGNGTIQAKAVGCALGTCMLPNRDLRRGRASLLETGLAANGERFKTFDVIATLDGRSQVVYVTESGKRFAMPAASLPVGRVDLGKKSG